MWRRIAISLLFAFIPAFAACGTPSTRPAGLLVTAPEIMPPEIVVSRPQTRWQTGDTWKLKVQLFGHDDGVFSGRPSKITVLLDTYHVHVHVTGSEVAENFDCWKVDLSTDKDCLVNDWHQAYRLWVGKSDGVLHRLVEIEDGKESERSRKQFGNITAIEWVSVLYPFEIVPHLRDTRYEPRNVLCTLQISTKVSEADEMVCLKYQATGNQNWTVSQSWKHGEKWWSTYERLDWDGVVRMRAECVKD